MNSVEEYQFRVQKQCLNIEEQLCLDNFNFWAPLFFKMCPIFVSSSFIYFRKHQNFLQTLWLLGITYLILYTLNGYSTTKVILLYKVQWLEAKVWRWTNFQGPRNSVAKTSWPTKWDQSFFEVVDYINACAVLDSTLLWSEFKNLNGH